MPLIELTNENFDTEIDRSSLMVVDFWAPWCAPCKGFAPVFEAASERHPDILFARVNTEAEPLLAKQFGIQSIPTLLAAKDGEIVQAKVGSLTPDKFEKLIKDLRKS